jgi:uncharacterized protein YjbI with pentapeptide repeats
MRDEERRMTNERESTSVGPGERSSRFPRRLVVLASFLVALMGVIVAWQGWFGFAEKTVWNYLDVFLVPAAVAVASVWLTWEQNERQSKDEAAQDIRALEVENQRAQDQALEAYLDEISQLLTDEKRPLRRALPPDNLSTVARARTLTALSRLDGGRKRSVLQFLYEADLLTKGHVVVDLRGANLSKADLGLADLSAANLHRAELREADLSEADLSEANLVKADLRNAHLRGANLHRADLSEADLSEANLGETDLREADLTNATMPDGQKYEDWLKDKGDRGEDGGQRGPS